MAALRREAEVRTSNHVRLLTASSGRSHARLLTDHNPKLPLGCLAIVAVACPNKEQFAMMEYRGLLETLAQLFIAFAGFAGIVAAFSTIRLSPEITVFRLRALVAVALFSLVVSLLPFLPEAFNASEAAALRISAFLFGVGMCGIALWIWRQLSPLYSAHVLDTQVFATLLFTAAALLTIGLFSVSAGLMVEMAPAIYLSGLFLGIIMCSFYFIMVILAVEIRTLK